MIAKNPLGRVLAYTGLESILYQSLLLIHQLSLYSVLPRELYGSVGTLFSVAYLGALCANAGLDLSIKSFFNQEIRSKQAFERLIFKQILFNMLFASFGLALSTYWLSSNYALYVYLWAPLVLTESTKKTIKTVLHLSFFQRSIAYIEVASICAYITFIWSALVTGCTPSVPLLLLPMIGVSVIAVAIYSFLAWGLYCSLDTQLSNHDSISWQNLAQQRVKNSLYQISKSVYSGNFLVPLIGAHFGLELAGTIKVISMCAYSLNSIIQHIFGITCDVFFSQLKKHSKQIKAKLFHTVSSYIYQVVFIICLGIFFSHHYIHFMFPDVPTTHLYIIYLFLLIIFSENLAVTHEHFLIIEDKAIWLILCNVLLLLPMYSAKYFYHEFAIKHLLIGLIIIRCASFIILSALSWKRWRIRPTLHAKPTYLSVSAAVAFAYFLLS